MALPLTVLSEDQGLELWAMLSNRLPLGMVFKEEGHYSVTYCYYLMELPWQSNDTFRVDGIYYSRARALARARCVVLYLPGGTLGVPSRYVQYTLAETLEKHGFGRDGGIQSRFPDPSLSK